jgi:broad specificity phosphatase PhoE
MAIFHLVRHGQHNMPGRRLPGRTPYVGLTERGQAEVASVADHLARESIVALYSSPLQRTRESAEIIAARLDLPIEFREELIELDFGEWTGATTDTIRADPRWEPWHRHRGLATIPGGENMRAVQHRAVETLFDINGQRGVEEAVAIVSHGDVIRAILLFALGMPLDFYARLEIAQGSISTFRIDAGGLRVTALNYRPHRP